MMSSIFIPSSYWRQWKALLRSYGAPAVHDRSQERHLPDNLIQNRCMDKGYDFPDIEE